MRRSVLWLIIASLCLYLSIKATESQLHAKAATEKQQTIDQMQAEEKLRVFKYIYGFDYDQWNPQNETRIQARQKQLATEIEPLNKKLEAHVNDHYLIFGSAQRDFDEATLRYRFAVKAADDLAPIHRYQTRRGSNE